MHAIEVAPLAGGWRVTSDQLAGDMVFRSGRAAEAAARRLAARLADSGESAELRIRLRDNSLAGRFVWPAASEDGDLGAAWPAS